MTLNFPGPFELELSYSTTIAAAGGILEHVQRTNLNVISDPSPGTPFNSIQVLLRDGSNDDLNSVFNLSWYSLLLGVHSTQTTINTVTLWKYTPGTFVREFISAIAVGVAGSNGAAVIPASELILSIRTMEGGRMYVKFLELAGVIPGSFDTPPVSDPNIQDIIDYLEGPTCPWLARDTSYPLAVDKALPGQNEAVWKERYGRT